MSVIVIASITFKTHDWIEAYKRGAPPLVEKNGGRFIVSSAAPSLVEGDGPIPDVVSILEFPSMDHVRALQEMPEYQPFLAARQAGAITLVLALENG